MLQIANLFVLIFLTLLPHKTNNEKTPDHVIYIRKIYCDFIKKIKREYKLECCASGGSMPHDIDELYLPFITNRPATIDEARDLEVLIIEKLAEMINQDEAIRPFLREYPFSAKRISISIRFNSLKRELSNNSIALICKAKDKILFKKVHQENPYLFDTIKEEPYQVSLQIVRDKL